MFTIELLDCTLRDGGLCLEDMQSYNCISPFTVLQKNNVCNFLFHSGIDIIEIGSIEISEKNKAGFAIYQNIENASNSIPKFSERYAVLYRGPDTPQENIPEWKEGRVRKARVIIRYSELTKSVEFCKILAKKGYEVFIQPMVTLRYKPEEIEYMISAANEMNAYALYFVDSYGCMDYSDVEYLFGIYQEKLERNIYIGFHAHNNMNMAFANVRKFIELAKAMDRKIIIDSTCLGMGQGAGNMQTELIVPYLNRNYGKDYDFEAVLKSCEEIAPLATEGAWGYSLMRLLPAIHRTAYKYAVSMRLKYGMKFSEIDHVLKLMPDELRWRYTADNLDILLKNGVDHGCA